MKISSHILPMLAIALGFVGGMLAAPLVIVISLFVVWAGSVAFVYPLEKIGRLIARRGKRAYMWNYPLACAETVMFNLTLGLLFCGLFFAFSGIGVWSNIQRLSYEGFSWAPVLWIVVCSPFLIGSALLMSAPLWEFVRGLVQRQLPVALKAFTHGTGMAIPDPRDPRNHYGYALAQHCKILDRIAEEKNVTPLYAMGVVQEGEKTQAWFPSAQGLETIDALLESVAGSDSRLDTDVCKDLQMMRVVVEKCDRFHIVLV